MSADNKFAETLARIEHKLDVTMSMLAWLMAQNPFSHDFLEKLVKFEQVGSTQHKCFLCTQKVEYVVDPIDSVVVRKCGCKTGKIALDMKAFAPPAMPVPKKENDSGEQQEDRRDPASRRGPGGR